MPERAPQLLARIGAQDPVEPAVGPLQAGELDGVGRHCCLAAREAMPAQRLRGEVQERSTQVKLVGLVIEIGEPCEEPFPNQRLENGRRKNAVMLDR